MRFPRSKSESPLFRFWRITMGMAWRIRRGFRFSYMAGAYVVGSPRTAASIVVPMTCAMQVPCIVVDYRLAPEAPVPGRVKRCPCGLRGVARNLSR